MAILEMPQSVRRGTFYGEQLHDGAHFFLCPEKDLDSPVSKLIRDANFHFFQTLGIKQTPILRANDWAVFP